MWPWEHAAVAYLCWAALDRRAARSEGAAVVAVLVGSQFPDLIDKPLSWVFQVLPTGQSLAHSLLFALPLIGLVVALDSGEHFSRLHPRAEIVGDAVQ